MNHLGPEEALAQLAQQPQPCARGQLFEVTRVKVEEAQLYRILAVAHAAHERTLRPVLDQGLLDLCFDLHRLAGRRIVHTHDLGFIFVAQRQMEDEIELPPHPEAIQLLAGGRRRTG